MINRKMALLLAPLIVLMFVMAVWRIITLEQWSIADQNGATVPSLFLLFFPACSAFLVGVLYRKNLRARADAAKLEPWRKWGAFFSISHCSGLLLLQVMLIVRSFNVDLPPPAIARTLSVMMVIVGLLAINQIPKLPYFGWDMGPIYGPRYVRTMSRMLALFVIAAITALLVGGPSMVWRSTLFFVLAIAFLMVCGITWRLHLARKWKRQQSAEPGLT